MALNSMFNQRNDTSRNKMKTFEVLLTSSATNTRQVSIIIVYTYVFFYLETVSLRLLSVDISYWCDIISCTFIISPQTNSIKEFGKCRGHARLRNKFSLEIL